MHNFKQDFTITSTLYQILLSKTDVKELLEEIEEGYIFEESFGCVYNDDEHVFIKIIPFEDSKWIKSLETFFKDFVQGKTNLGFSHDKNINLVGSIFVHHNEAAYIVEAIKNTAFE